MNLHGCLINNRFMGVGRNRNDDDDNNGKRLV